MSDIVKWEMRRLVGAYKAYPLGPVVGQGTEISHDGYRWPLYLNIGGPESPGVYILAVTMDTIVTTPKVEKPQ